MAALDILAFIYDELVQLIWCGEKREAFAIQSKMKACIQLMGL